MDTPTAPDRQDQQSLLAQLAQAKDKADAIALDLRPLDAELDGLAIERQQLDRRISEVEERRNALIERIRQQQHNAGLFEDALFEAQEEEERRKQEWIIEREIGELPARKAAMPWAHGGEADRRFRKTLASALALCLLFALIVPHIELPLHVLKPKSEPPQRVVRLLMEARRKPAPPAPPPMQSKPKPQEKLAEQKPAQHPVTPERESPDKGPVSPDKEPAPQGILAFREKLASLRHSSVSPSLGLQARISNADDNAAGQTQRSMLTKLGPGSSGGINLAGLSRNVGGGGGGGGGMAGVQVTRAASGIGGSGPAGGDRPMGGGPGLGRTDEEIQIVFDRYKAALYRLYNRELRKDPTLRGQLVLRLTIEPNGSVSMCAVQSSDMNAPELSSQVVERVKTFDFGAKEVSTITILYPIDFLPAA